MSERNNNLVIDTNIDYPVKLMYDECKSGVSQHGPWNLYMVEHNGTPHSIFADEKLHPMLRKYKRGDEIIIRRNQTNQNEVFWEVNRITNGNGSDPSQANARLDDRTLDIHRQVALKIATQSMGPTTKPWTDYEKTEIQSRVNALLGILEGETEDDLPF